MEKYDCPDICPFDIMFLSDNTYITNIHQDIVLNKIKKLLHINKIIISGSRWNLDCLYTNSIKNLHFHIHIHKYKEDKLFIELYRYDRNRMYMNEFNSYFEKHLNFNYFFREEFNRFGKNSINNNNNNNNNNNIINLPFFIFCLTQTTKKGYLYINKYRNIVHLLTKYLSLELFNPEKTNKWKPLPLPIGF